MNPIFYFIAFVLFILCQYSIIMVSMFVANLSNATGHYWWSITIVVFLLLNELCFHNYDFELNLGDDDRSDEYDWLEDDE